MTAQNVAGKQAAGTIAPATAGLRVAAPGTTW